jgi:DNA transformation protein
VAKRSEFAEHVTEMMRTFGPVEVRAMFGGHGIYHRGTMFALIAEDALYIKTDEINRPEFVALGLGPFVFKSKDGEAMTLSYCSVPDDALESPAVMAEWARSGYACALRAAAKKTKKKR